MWFVYILECRDGSLYTGATNDLQRRFLAHQNGKGGNYTRSHQPRKIVYSEKIGTKSEALRREATIKGLSRGKKLQLIRFHKA